MGEERDDEPNNKPAETMQPSRVQENRNIGVGETPPADLKVKYDELVQYTLLLEKEKKKLELDLAQINANKGGAVASSEGYGTFQLVLVALLAFFVSYAVKFFF